MQSKICLFFCKIKVFFLFMTDYYNRRNYTSVKIVELDTKIFKGKKPRDWHKIVKDYVYNLVGGAGTVYDSNKTDTTYARIDGELLILGILH